MIAQRARASHQRKNKTPVGVSANFQCGNPHRKPDFHGGKTPTTGHGGKTPTTSKISGKPRSGRASSSLASQHAGQGRPGRYVLFADPRAMQQFYDVGKGRYVAPPAWHDGDAGMVAGAISPIAVMTDSGILKALWRKHCKLHHASIGARG